MKSNPMCLTVLLVMLIGQAGTVQASDPAGRSDVISQREVPAHVLSSGEIDSSKVEVGAYVEVTYYKGEKLDTVRGYIKAVDSGTLTIGRGLWQEQIAFERIQKLILAESGRDIDSVKKRAATLLKKDKRGEGLMLEVGRYQRRNTSSDLLRLPWSLSYYFQHIISGEKSQRFGMKYTHHVVEILEDFSRDDQTYWTSSLLLVYQRVVTRNTRIVVLADLAAGIALSNSVGSCGDWICLPEIGSRYSVGLGFLLPIHTHIGLQATVRADLLSVNDQYPLPSGMSVAFGLLYEIY